MKIGIFKEQIFIGMISWHEIPFVRIVIPFILGIILGSYVSNTKVEYWLISIIVMSIAGFISYRMKKNMFFFLFFFLAIFGSGFSRLSTQSTGEIKSYSVGDQKQKITLVAKVLNVPKINKYCKLELELLQLGIDRDSLKVVHGKILSFLKVRDSMSVPEMGDLIVATGYLNEVKANTNPYSFDYAQYLSRQGIKYQIFCDSLDWSYSDANQSKGWFQYVTDIRQTSLGVLREYLHDEDQFGVASAMILGYKDEIRDELYTAYSETGAVHVLAVSGLHVGIVAYTFLWLLNLIPIKNRVWKILKIILLLCAIWFYAMLTGAAPAVIRAAIMFSILIVSKEVDGRTNIYNTIALSALIMLIFDPFLIFHLGFQFSYLAVISIVFFHPFVSAWIKIDNRIVQKIWSYMAVALSAQVLVFPLTIFYFHKFPLYFWLSGVIVIPSAIIIICGGIFLLICHFLIPSIAVFVAKVFCGFLDLFNGSIKMIQGLPYSKVDNIWCDQILMMLLFVMIFCLIRWCYTYRGYWLVRMFCLVFISLSYFSCQRYVALNNQSITIYDVNKGFITDFAIGDTVYSLNSQNLSDKTIAYSTNGNRLNGMVSNTISLNEAIQTDQIYKNDDLVFFGDQLIQIIHDSTKVVSNNADYLIYNSSNFKDFTDLVTPKVILTGGLSFYEHQRVQELLEDSNIEFHSIRDQGALIINMEK